jgi:hypothetical protein
LRRRRTVRLKEGLYAEFLSALYEKTIVAPPSETYFQSDTFVVVGSKDIVMVETDWLEMRLPCIPVY